MSEYRYYEFLAVDRPVLDRPLANREMRRQHKARGQVFADAPVDMRVAEPAGAARAHEDRAGG
jgi:hypothetical protein